MKKKYCIMCHFDSDYNHYHPEKWSLLSNDGKPFYQVVDVWDGFFTDVNGICLPCQAMSRFKL